MERIFNVSCVLPTPLGDWWDRWFYFASGLVRKALGRQHGEFDLHPLDSMGHRNTWKSLLALE